MTPTNAFGPQPGPGDLRFEYQSANGRDGFEPDPFRTSSEFFGPFRVDYKQHTLYLDNWNLGVGSGLLDRPGLGNLIVGNGHKFKGTFNSAIVGVNNTANGSYNFVAGRDNFAQGRGSVVAGGEGNVALSSHTSIDGGEENVAKKFFAVVQGGYQNAAEAPFAVVAAGMYNWAGGNASSVTGGTMNSADAEFSSVNGGQSNMVPGPNNSEALEGGHHIGWPKPLPLPGIVIPAGEGPPVEHAPCTSAACNKAFMAELSSEVGATRDRRAKKEKASKGHMAPGLTPGDLNFRRRRSSELDKS